MLLRYSSALRLGREAAEGMRQSWTMQAFAMKLFKGKLKQKNYQLKLYSVSGLYQVCAWTCLSFPNMWEESLVSSEVIYTSQLTVWLCRLWLSKFYIICILQMNALIQIMGWSVWDYCSSTKLTCKTCGFLLALTSWVCRIDKSIIILEGFEQCNDGISRQNKWTLKYPVRI